MNDTPKLTPAELAVSLFCQGLRLDSSCRTESDARPLSPRRAGLGSGIELVIPGAGKDIWINAPLTERFAANSPYLLQRIPDGYVVVQQGHEHSWPVLLPPTPHWYQARTTSGKPMSRIGILQGTCLGIYIGKRCAFWQMSPAMQCHFCATGINVGVHEEAEKTVAEVVETVRAARRESGITFVHFNSGYQEGNDIAQLLPFVEAVKNEVGALVGVQCIPPPDPEEYAPLLRLGVDHFSLCYELQDSEYFARYLPGKAKHIGQKRFLGALEFLCRRMPRATVSGEIIAGLEPTSKTLEAIDYITDQGAFPTVCIFRPLAGSVLQDKEPPGYAEIVAILRYMALTCMRKNILVGLAPNIEVSLVMTPDDARYLLPRDFVWYLHHSKLKLLKWLVRPYFSWKMRKRR
jgi:hypothetical protein